VIPDRIEHLQTVEILLVIRNDNTVVRERNSGDDGIQRAARTSVRRAHGHQFGPYQGNKQVSVNLLAHPRD
jgi:hypothetical protein